MESRALMFRSTSYVRRVGRLLIGAIVGCAVFGQSVLGGGINRTIVTPILHTGDPAPGIAGATVVWVGKPQIDAGGAVSFEGFIAGDGVDPSNNLVLWYGPPGGLAVVAREGDQVPGLPAGVIYDDWEVTYTMGEDGTLSIGAILAGPGVIPDVNDKALLVGPAGDLQPVIRAGDKAPGMPAGVIVTPEFSYASELTDDGRFLTQFKMDGPGIDETNDVGFWAVDDTGWHLVVRTGDPAPGTEPGVTFAWMDGVRFNPNMEIAFRGGLTGPPIDYDNDAGTWHGPPGDVQLVAREGDPAWGIEGDVYFNGGGSPALSDEGGVALGIGLRGEGVTSENDFARWVFSSPDTYLLVREGDPVPGLGPGVTFGPGGNAIVSASARVAFIMRFRGEVTEENDAAVLFGPYDNPRLILREGDAFAPPGAGIVFDNLLFAVEALNDGGDVLGIAKIRGSGTDPENNIVFILRDHRTGVWYPLVRTGEQFDGGVFAMSELIDGINLFWAGTGGSDGLRESLNDAAQFAMKLSFADGSLGNYLFELPPLGDFNTDGSVDLLDYEAFLACVTGPGATDVAPSCDTFDVDWDGDVDHADFGLFQVLFAINE